MPSERLFTRVSRDSFINPALSGYLIEKLLLKTLPFFFTNLFSNC